MGRDGFTLIEMLLVVVVAALVVSVSVPQTLSTVERSRARAAARFLAGRVALVRLQSIVRSTSMAIRFQEGPGGFTFSVVEDGNRNGVRTRDIDMGVDPVIEPPALLAELFPGVEIGVIEAVGGSPVQLGGTQLLSFTPLGTATSGSIYVRGRQGTQFVVRVLGATGRARVLEYDVRRAEWNELM
jgi:prepilin-type N-terminal cleavage/methylation domain-containing protein